MPHAITALRNVLTVLPRGEGHPHVWSRYPLRLDGRCVIADDGELRPHVARKHRLVVHVLLADIAAAVAESASKGPEEILDAMEWLYFLGGID